MRKFPFVQHNHYIAILERLELMGDRYYRLALKFLSNNVVHQFFGVRI